MTGREAYPGKAGATCGQRETYSSRQSDRQTCRVSGIASCKLQHSHKAAVPKLSRLTRRSSATMDRSVGTHALLEESWTTPWLDDGTFPYWPEAARMGNLEEFLWWLQVQDKERAALVVRHAQEFKKVYSFITRELTRTHNSNFSSSGSSGSTSSASGSVRDGSSTVRRASNTSAGMAAGGVGLGVFGSRRDHASYLPRSCTAKSNNGGTDKGDQEQLGWSPSGAAEALPSTATRRSRSADGASSGSSIPAHLAQRVQRRRQSDTRRNDNKTTVSHVASMPGGTASWPLSAGGVVRRSSGFASIDNASYPPAATERSCPQADVAVRTAAVNSVPSISNEPRGTRAVTVFSSSLMAEPRSEHVGRSGSGLRRRNNKVSWVDGVNISSHLNSESINALGVNMGAKPSLEESKRQERSGREVTVVETHTIVAGGEVAAGRMGVPVPKPAGTRSATTNRWEIGRGGVFDPRQPLPQNSAVEGAAVSGRPSFTRPDDGRTAGTIINAAVGAGSRTGRWQTSQGIDGASGDGEGGRNNHGVRRRASADGTERTSSSSCLEDFQPSTPTQPKSAFSRDELVQHSRELSSSSAPAILVPPPQRSLHHRWRAQRQQARQKLLKEEEQHEKRVSRSLSNALVHEDDRGGEVSTVKGKTVIRFFCFELLMVFCSGDNCLNTIPRDKLRNSIYV